MYRFGRGVPQNLPEAVRWFRAAAEQGHARAQAILGSCYNEGLGVERNEAEAIRWLRRGADKDYPEAQYLLALQYLKGMGVARDMQEMGAQWKPKKRLRPEGMPDWEWLSISPSPSGDTARP